MICWTSTDVLLNLVTRLDSAVLSLGFDQISIFWSTSSFDLVSFLFDSLSVGTRSPELYFLYSISVILHVTLSELIMVYGFDSISIGHFLVMICSISAEGSLNVVAH